MLSYSQCISRKEEADGWEWSWPAVEWSQHLHSQEVAQCSNVRIKNNITTKKKSVLPESAANIKFWAKIFVETNPNVSAQVSEHSGRRRFKGRSWWVRKTFRSCHSCLNKLFRSWWVRKTFKSFHSCLNKLLRSWWVRKSFKSCHVSV